MSHTSCTKPPSAPLHLSTSYLQTTTTGGDDNGSWENSTSFAAQMRRLYASLSSIAAVPEVMLPSSLFPLPSSLIPHVPSPSGI